VMVLEITATHVTAVYEVLVMSNCPLPWLFELP
jgi:hypothetical protein